MYVLAELKEYLDGNPADAASTSLTVQFLEALNQLFEEGFLSHNQIDSMSSPVLNKMSNGYKFFTAWLDSLLAEGKLSSLPRFGHVVKYVYIHVHVYIVILICRSDAFHFAGLVPTHPHQKSFLAWQVQRYMYVDLCLVSM